MITSSRIQRYAKDKSAVVAKKSENKVEQVKIETEKISAEPEITISNDAPPEGSFRTKLVAFLIGIGFSTLGCGWFLNQSFNDSATLVTRKVDHMASQVVESQRILTERVAKLEQHLSKLEGK